MDDLISKLSEIRSDYNCFNAGEEPYYRALSEAIRILSQLADGDTISRQAAIDCVTYDVEHTIECLKALSSAQPEQRWIPCSKRLPENRRYVLVTYQHEYGLIDHGITWCGEAEKKWDTSRNVVAWMPLPTPYREE